MTKFQIIVLTVYNSNVRLKILLLLRASPTEICLAADILLLAFEAYLTVVLLLLRVSVTGHNQELHGEHFLSLKYLVLNHVVVIILVDYLICLYFKGPFGDNGIRIVALRQVLLVISTKKLWLVFNDHGNAGANQDLKNVLYVLLLRKFLL